MSDIFVNASYTLGAGLIVFGIPALIMLGLTVLVIRYYEREGK